MELCVIKSMRNDAKNYYLEVMDFIYKLPPIQNKSLKTNPYTNSLNTIMEQLKIISTILPFGAFLAIDDTEYMEDLNSNLITWVKKHKPKSYRIINVAVQEVSHQEAMLYMMFIAYE